MRIVAGAWRGRQIKVPAGDLIRPTGDRVREAWMSIVRTSLPDAKVLDLFSGSGALGLEALSRGAREAHFVENAAKSLQVLAANIATLGAGDRAIIHRADALRFIDTIGEGRFDVAFADPPYDKGIATAIAEKWMAKPFADLLGIEHRRDEQLPGDGDIRSYGGTSLTFYRATDHYHQPLATNIRPMKRTAIYAGSFDPITRGHEDLIHRTVGFVDHLIVAVAQNSAKQPLFNVEERTKMIKEAVGDDKRIEVRTFTGLLVDFAGSIGSRLLVRGLRAVSDFEYEYQMALMNRHLSPSIETVFMVPSLDTTYISASMVREVARYGGDLTNLVHPSVAEALRRKNQRA